MRDTDTIRRDQIDAGRAANAGAGGTITVTERRGPKDFHHSTRSGGTGPAKPFRKFVPKGHDAILAKAQDNKDLVEICTMSGEFFVGTIEGRDKFTITLKEDSSGDTCTFYKHGIERFKLKGAA